MADLKTELYSPFLIENSYVRAPKKSNATDNNTELQDELSGKKKAEKKSDKKEPSRFTSFIKGVGNFFKGMVCDEQGKFSLTQTLKTVGIGALIAGASILIPGAGTVIALGALGLAGKNIISAGIDIANAETADEINAAYENLGSGVTEGALAYAGVRATGGFGALRNAAKTVKTTTSDLYSSYKAGGLKGLKTEANTVKTQAWDSIQTTYKTTRQGTIDNYKNLTNSKAKYDAKIKSYDEKIKASKGADKKALQAEKAAYEKGYNKVATETNYETAYNTLETMKADLAKAKEAATKKGASPKAKADYKNKLAEYDAAESTLKARVNNGDFQAKTKKGTPSKKEINKAEKATENAYNEMKAKRDALRKATTKEDIKKAQAEYDKAFNEYQKAAANEKAIKGETSKRYIISQTVGEGMKLPGTKWSTAAWAGRDKTIDYAA